MIDVSRTRGFTLLDILIAAAIVGLLTAVVLFNASQARSSARDKARAADLSQVQVALRLYAEENNSYPTYDSGVSVGEGSAFDGDVGPYFTQVPRDPLESSSDHQYHYDSSYTCQGEDLAVLLANMEGGDVGNHQAVCGTAPGGVYDYVVIVR